MRAMLLITLSLLVLGAVAAPADAQPISGGDCDIEWTEVTTSPDLGGHAYLPTGLDCKY